ncbi:MAG: PhnD/SsuA/transferrin family substrate-binding protein, partial [Planctomycetes bacterium]|nr:PhnD/SsuA/transferrin family substrate-binding protein [Planctomycetota bacterium]
MTWIQKMSLRWLAAASLASAIPQPASAGAWAQPKGHLYTKLSSLFYRSDEVFDDAGHRQPTTIYGADFRADQGFLYVEYGLLEHLTVITQLSGASLESENNIRHNVLRLTTSGLGDFLVGAKYQLVSKPIVLSPYVNVKIPTNYDGDLNPALGTGDMDVEVRLLAARSFYPLPVYVGAEAGYRLRGGPFSNQIGFSGEIGATPLSRLSIKAYLEKETGLSVDGFVSLHYGSSIEAMRGGNADVAFVDPLAFMLAHEQIGAVPLLLEVYDGGRATYHSCIWVRKDSGIKTLADLRGRTMAFADPVDMSGYLAPRDIFERAGLMTK